ncbi:cell division protein FtsB [Nitrobacteraceae bacterium AZCC 2161]
MTARLRLNRLSVHRATHVLYDQIFHEGVNIIHGDNGSGKSTITDFIYFALGGDLKEWRVEAKLADYVLAEITAQEAVLTLRRDVSETGNRPMQIFFGPYDQALTSDLRNWETLPYKRPDAGYSFSQVLFKAIGIPEAISDGVSNITMHQLLRVLYSDQLTPIQRIFRVERFDAWQTRQAVGDVLCGLGGYDLFGLQLFLRDLEKEHDEVSTRLKSLIAVASSYGDKVLLIEHVSSAIANANAEREKLQAVLMTHLQQADERASSTEADKLIRKQRRNLINARAKVADLADEIETLEFEITDSDNFMDHLRQAIDEFDDASSTFNALGAVRFEFCPSCFAPIQGHEHDEEACHLCGTTTIKPEKDSRALAVHLDLQMQLNESLELQADRDRTLAELKSQHRAAVTSLRSITANSRVTISSAASALETLVSDTSRQIGYIDHEIELLQQREGLAREISQLSNEKSELNARISEMKDRIAATEAVQRRRRSVAYSTIANVTKRLLELDLPEHSDFGEINSVSFSFRDDWIAVNDDKGRIGSASGMVVLKNTFLLGLFAASLIDAEFNLPRFMLMDNIEDKGMVQERSWNFQRNIVRVSENSAVSHQIIFSTSKIAPELANTRFVVERKYTQTDHSLRLLVRNVGTL